MARDCILDTELSVRLLVSWITFVQSSAVERVTARCVCVCVTRRRWAAGGEQATRGRAAETAPRPGRFSRPERGSSVSDAQETAGHHERDVRTAGGTAENETEVRQFIFRADYT